MYMLDTNICIYVINERDDAYGWRTGLDPDLPALRHIWAFTASVPARV